MEMEIKHGRCASCTGEINHDEGYCSLFIVIKFKDEIPDEFEHFLYDRIQKIGVDDGKKPSHPLALETGFLYTEDGFNKTIYIDMGRADTEYDYFEEYFESENFIKWMEEAIKEFKNN
jgi:hypothetical protein